MLDIRNLGLRSLKEVNIPEYITKLICDNNELETLEGLEKCINLTELNCSNNELETLEGIEKYINLTKLNCGNNKLKTLEFFTRVKYINLAKLECGGNELETLKGIERCNKLTELDCKRNELRKLKYCPESIEDIRYDFFNDMIKEEYRGKDIREIHRINKEKWERSIYKEVMKEDNFL